MAHDPALVSPESGDTSQPGTPAILRLRTGSLQPQCLNPGFAKRRRAQKSAGNLALLLWTGPLYSPDHARGRLAEPPPAVSVPHRWADASRFARRDRQFAALCGRGYRLFP